MIQAREEQQILNEFPLLQLLAIENTSIVDNLPEKLYGRLRPILIHIGHVQIINERNEHLIHRTTVSLTGLLIQHSLDVPLEGLGVGERREVDGLVGDLLGLGGREVVFDDLGLAGTGATHEQHGFLALQVDVEEVPQTGGVDRRHEDLGEDGFVAGDVVGDLG